jgi:Cu(I)/Ag(I) efflux system membrane protein CusA/SilA
MIDRIIDFSARHRPLVFVCVAAAVWAGWRWMGRIPLDVLPNLGDTQVIVYSRWDRSPDVVEDQVTFPVVTAMLGTPRVKDVRGFSDFGYSYVYVVFEDNTDAYWARSRALESLQKVTSRLPDGVRPELGPDATGLGWVYQYVLQDKSGRHDLAELRSVQDWYLRLQLETVPGVAEVASLGGFVRQYQVNVDPGRLREYGIPIQKVAAAVRAGNNDTGGRLVELRGREYMVRGRGYAKSAGDLERIALSTGAGGVPVTIRDVGRVTLGPDLRRGVADWNGDGEAVSGIVVMRQNENALRVIERVRNKLRDLEPGLPEGVRVVPVYDRSELILASVRNLRETLIEELIVVSLVILVLLWHAPSAAIPVVTIAAGVTVAFLPMGLLGISANVMSLGGIAIAVGAMVDAAIVVVEQTHKKLEEWDARGRRENVESVIVRAVKEVGGPSFFALLILAVSFLPVLALEAEEGRLFRPLAYTKTIAMIVAAVLAITLDPALRLWMTRMKPVRLRPAWLARGVNAVAVGTIHSEERHPVSRFLIRCYQPVVAWTLRRRWLVLAAAAVLVAATVPVYWQLGSEFMPPLDEGSLLYMPSTLPGISISEARRLVRAQDRVLRGFPEVKSVFGKAGRAETSTDPAPLSMIETVILLKPRQEWRAAATWYDRWPGFLKPLCRRITSDLISPQQLVREMDRALQTPGVSNAWTMPVKNRIDMQSTGIRTALGVKIYGSDVKQLERIGEQVQAVLEGVPGTRSVFAEKSGTGYYLDVRFDREQLARYGLSIEDGEEAVASAIGGENVSTIYQGRQRYPVNVRYLSDFRSDPEALGRVLVAGSGAEQVPLNQVADIELVEGPAMLRDENGMLDGYVYIDVNGRDLGSYVAEAARLVRDRVPLPPGYSLAWSGQYEAMERVRGRLREVVPLVLALVFALLYLNTRSAGRTLLILLAVPFSCVGACWLLWALGYNMSVGVWVGMIALMGVDAETGMFMVLYIDLAVEEWRQRGRLTSRRELREAIVYGAARRIRPKFMTVATMFLGLVPILFATGAGSDVMKRIAAPMAGGIFTSFLLELLVYPPLYELCLIPKLERSTSGEVYYSEIHPGPGIMPRARS